MTRLASKTLLLASACDAALLQFCVLRPHRDWHSPEIGLIARIRLWLKLLWGAPAVEPRFYYEYCYQPNRAKSRLAKRFLPLSRRVNPLGVIMWRAFGRARYLRFIYDECLTGRYSWCFTDWNWKWAKRVSFKENPMTRCKNRVSLRCCPERLAKLKPD